jgi:site-specific recombinase XerD
MSVSPSVRVRKDLAAGPYQPAISSFRLHLGAEGKSPKTIRTYVEAVQWFAAAHLRAQPDRADWTDVTDEDVKIWMVFLLDRYSDSYANNQYRALQQFFKWWADDEEAPNPMARLKPPAVGEKVVPVFTEDELIRAVEDMQRQDVHGPPRQGNHRTVQGDRYSAVRDGEHHVRPGPPGAR